MASYSAAKAAAAGSGRIATMYVNGNKIWVTAKPRLKAGAGTVDTIVLPKNLYTMYGVTAATTNGDTVTVNQTGLGNLANEVRLTHGNIADTIRINQYGRVLK
jgi:hypothetical protein